MKQIVKIELKNIDSFKDHPFKVQRDDSFNELKESIKENGLLEPLLVRLKDNGRYELISGHRSKLALELNWITEADCYVEELDDDDEATIKMVDSNIYRNLILPSEKRLKEIAELYEVSVNAIKKYDFNNPIDIIYLHIMR